MTDLVDDMMDAIPPFLPPGSLMLLLRDRGDQEPSGYSWSNVLAALPIAHPIAPAVNHSITIPYAGGFSVAAGRAHRFVMIDPRGTPHIFGTVGRRGKRGDLIVDMPVKPERDFGHDSPWIETNQMVPAGALQLVHWL